MRLLDRYLLRELLIPLAYCLSGFLLFWISFDLFSDLEKFQQEHLSALRIVHYYILKTPELLVEVIPVSLLLALLYALTNHARHHELTAIRAAGVSLWRLSVPYLGVGFVFSILLFCLNEIWAPKSVAATKAILGQKYLIRTANGRWYNGLNISNARDGRIWNIKSFNVDTYEMLSPHVSWEADGRQHSLIATNAIRTNDSWVFFDVQEFTYVPSVEVSTNITDLGETNIIKKPSIETLSSRTNLLAVPEFSETPEQIKSEIRISRLTGLQAAKEAQLSIEEILNYFRLHPVLTKQDNAMLRTQLHGRFAYPWTCLVVVLIAIPFGAASGRRNVFVGVASSIFICFTFFILLRFGLALGTNQFLPPVLAAWLPNLVFGSAGIWMTSQVR